MTLLILFICGTWTESFETQNFFPPDDWMIVNEDALDAVWYRVTGAGHTGTKVAACYYDTAYTDLNYTNLDYLITPRVLPQAGDTLLSFWCISTTAAGCSLDVMTSTASPISMPSLNVVQTINATSTSWTQYSISLSSYIGAPVYIAFRIRRIPINNVFALDDITLPDRASQPYICNGRLRTKGTPSQKYLQVWGSHYQMGYAHGFYLAEEIIATFNNRWIGYTSYHACTPELYEGTYLPYFRTYYYVPQKFQDEAQGICDGIVAKGVSLYHSALGRDLTYEDFMFMTASTGPDKFGCSSVSGWGQSTAVDDTLQGGFVIGRNVDARVGLYTTMGNASLIIAYAPDDPGEQAFFNISMAGIFGAFSCINRNGVGLCQNTGNHPNVGTIPPNSLLGDFLSSRLGIENIDPDGNGVNDIFDIDSMKIPAEHVRSNDLHIFSPYDGSHPVPAAILEINQLGDTLRLVEHNAIPPAINSSWNLAVTNHDRLLYPPVSCWRYQRLADSLNADYQLTTPRVSRIANTVAISYDAATSQCTYHSMVLRPDLVVTNPDWPCVGVSYARCYRAAHTQGKVWYSWNELFEGVPGISIEEVAVNPAPKTILPATIIAGPLRLPKGKNWMVFDITGRNIDINHMPIGIYFVKIDGETVRKVVKIK
jgi:hypothetical protein